MSHPLPPRPRACRLVPRTLLLGALAACGGDPSTTDPAAAPVARVVLSGQRDTLFIGDTLRLSARALDAAGQPLTGRPIAWTSLVPGLATVTDGVVVGVGAGQAGIVATVGGSSATLLVAVRPQPVARVAFVDSVASRDIGATLAAAVRVYDRRGTVLADGRPVAFVSSAPSVATVDAVAGTVTAVAPGTALITATSEGQVGTLRFTVLPPPPVARVELARDEITLVEGAAAAATASTYDSTGRRLTDRAIRYASDAPAVAAVDADGRIAALSPGRATISATSEGRTATARVLVVPRPVARVAFPSGELALDEGGSALVAAVPYDAAGNALAGRAMTYASSAPAVATVDAGGRVVAVASGTARILAVSEGVEGTLAVTVRRVGAASVVFATPRTRQLAVGDTMTLSVTAHSAAGVPLPGRPARFASSAATVATVDATTGLVRATGAGVAVITASVDGVSQSLTLTVSGSTGSMPSTAPESIYLVSGTPTLEVGMSQVARVMAIYPGGRQLELKAGVTFQSESPAVARVDAGGVVTAVSPGLTRIWGTYPGVPRAATVVTVIAPGGARPDVER